MIVTNEINVLPQLVVPCVPYKFSVIEANCLIQLDACGKNASYSNVLGYLRTYLVLRWRCRSGQVRLKSGKTKGKSITVLLTSCLTGLD